MNFKGYKTRMEGFEGPVFPANIEALNKIHKKTSNDEEFVFEEAVKEINGFSTVGFAGESAGIRWKKVSIEKGDKKAVIYFPLSCPNSSEISITVYAKNLNQKEIEGIVEELLNLFRSGDREAAKSADENKKILAGKMAESSVGKIFGFFRKR